MSSGQDLRFMFAQWWDDLMAQPYVSHVVFNSSCNNKLHYNNYYSVLLPSLLHCATCLYMFSWPTCICRKQSLILNSDSDTVVAVEATEDMNMWSHDITSSPRDIGSFPIPIERHNTTYSRMNDQCILVANYSGIITMDFSFWQHGGPLQQSVPIDVRQYQL